MEEARSSGKQGRPVFGGFKIGCFKKILMRKSRETLSGSEELNYAVKREKKNKKRTIRRRGKPVVSQNQRS